MKVIVELADDEVLVALKRVEGYEDVHPELLTDDAIGEGWRNGERFMATKLCQLTPIRPPK